MRKEKLPQVNAERCVHSRLQIARCSACADVCPRSAWVLTDESLGLDGGRCDGCGICVPACSEGAIQPPQPLVVRYLSGGADIAFACERAVPGGSPDVIPCVNGFGLEDLARWHQRGVRRIRMATGDCRDCDRRVRPDLEETTRLFNLALRSRGVEPIHVHRTAGREWLEVVGTEVHSRMGRRAFLGRPAAALVRSATEEAGVERVRTAPGRCLGRPAPGALMPVVPVIDGARCTACDTCVRVCSHGAIQLHDDPLRYRIDARDCTGCGLCTDVCQAGAVRLVRWAAQVQSGLRLENRTCASCGVEHRSVHGRSSGSGRCPVCAVRDHHPSLFQVLD